MFELLFCLAQDIWKIAEPYLPQQADAQLALLEPQIRKALLQDPDKGVLLEVPFYEIPNPGSPQGFQLVPGNGGILYIGSGYQPMEALVSATMRPNIGPEQPVGTYSKSSYFIFVTAKLDGSMAVRKYQFAETLKAQARDLATRYQKLKPAPSDLSDIKEQIHISMTYYDAWQSAKAKAKSTDVAQSLDQLEKDRKTAIADAERLRQETNAAYADIERAANTQRVFNFLSTMISVGQLAEKMGRSSQKMPTQVPLEKVTGPLNERFRAIEDLQLQQYDRLNRSEGLLNEHYNKHYGHMVPIPLTPAPKAKDLQTITLP